MREGGVGRLRWTIERMVQFVVGKEKNSKMLTLTMLSSIGYFAIAALSK